MTVKEQYRVQWERSRRHLEKGELGLSLQALREALEIAPDDLMLWEEFYTQSMVGGLTQNALMCAARLRELAPDNVGFIQMHGMATLLAGQLAPAIASFEEALRLAPGSAEARQLLARALTVAGKKDRVRQLLEEAVALEPTAIGAANDLAVHYFENVPEDGKERAERVLTPVAEAHPNDAATHFNLALAFHGRDPARAKEHAELAAYYTRDEDLLKQAQWLLKELKG